VEVEMETLIEAAKDGDRAAFDEIVRRTYRNVFSLAVRLTGNEDDASDVTQEVYVRAFKAIKRFRGDAQISTWLYRICANCSSTFLKKRSRHRHAELDSESSIADPHPDADPTLQVEGSDIRARVDQAIRQLPERLRSVVVLRDAYDLSHQEIAEELDITESAAKVRLHRARKKLQSALGGLGDARDGTPGVEEAEHVS
jgi:RNA polymerase sigma-70 factor (ECF subfamily)